MEQRKPKNKYPSDNKNKKHKLAESSKISQVELPQNVPAATSSEVLTISEPVDQKYSKRKIVSNKEKYEKEIVNEDNEQMLAADFTKLLENPQSVGGFFQFSTEKQWFSDDNENEMTSKLFQEYFNLNLSLLNESISTIPFYKRLNLDKDLFNEREIEEMNRKAEKMEEKYRKNVEASRDNIRKFTGEVGKMNNNIMELLKVSDPPCDIKHDEEMQARDSDVHVETLPEKQRDVDAKSQRSTQKPMKVLKSQSPTPLPSKKYEGEHEDDLDEILKNPNRLNKVTETLPTKHVIAVDTIEVSSERQHPPSKEPVKAEEEDIQKWLDDVLND